MKKIDKDFSAQQIVDFLLKIHKLEVLEKIGAHNSKLIYLNEDLETNSSTSKKDSTMTAAAID